MTTVNKVMMTTTVEFVQIEIVWGFGSVVEERLSGKKSRWYI